MVKVIIRQKKCIFYKINKYLAEKKTGNPDRDMDVDFRGIIERLRMPLPPLSARWADLGWTHQG